ncbi:MAG: hypothetical protein NPIRA05_07150 [Nitrospirales bacterium]|nr:MAG: hypothetical protein NPIRA05_07150 [Nitrospirales bacterium]
MRTFPKYLALLLIILFLLFSFNAYACVVPIYGGMQVSQDSDCTKPGEEPALQFCDGFKSLAIQANFDIPSEWSSFILLDGNVPSLTSIEVATNPLPPIVAQGQSVPPKDTLVLISVFRI